WPDRRARWLALGSYVWRAIGVGLVLVTGRRALLLPFPNVFESIVLLYLIFRTLSGHQHMLQSTTAMLVVFIVLLVPKMGQEYALHVLQDNRPWDVIHLVPWPAANAWVLS